MGEHRIRLRGGWSCLTRPDEGPEEVRRIDLPVPSADGLPPRFRLTRQFGRPPLDPMMEGLCLEFRKVEGLRSARLNGRELPGRRDDDADWSVEIVEPLLLRNGLVLEVERPEQARDAGAGWGEISLVVRPR